MLVTPDAPGGAIARLGHQVTNPASQV